MSCSEKNKSIRCRLSFEAYGSCLAPESGKLMLDVGNRLCPGVIDHHQPDAYNECAASLLLRYPEYVLEHLKGVAAENITLVLHIEPDLDAVTAAFFAYHLIVNGKFPCFAEKIAAYVRDVDMGICFRHPGAIVTAYSIFAGLCEIIRKKGEADQETRDQIYRKVVECGFALWEYLISVMNEQSDLHDLSALNLPPRFQEARELIMQDYSLYLEDLRKSSFAAFRLPKKDGGFGQADALMSVDPKSLLFRSWARGDNRHSPRGKGFVMLAINYKHQRYVISTDPQSPYYLKGLGDLLEKAETEKRKPLGLERKGDSRPGYDNADPWYDGRNPLHNYTIIDTPRDGTVLTWEEIAAIVRDYGS